LSARLFHLPSGHLISEKSRPGVTPDGFLIRLPATFRFRRIYADADATW